MRRRLSIDDGFLFGQEPKPLELNSSVHPESEPRLTRQCRIILERLKEGPATNDELMALSRSRNFSARISDLRRNGVRIECFDLNQETGLSHYRLLGE